MKKVIKTDKAPQPGGPFSQGLIVGKTVQVGGQTPRHPATGVIPDGLENQVRQVLENVKAILEAGGARMEDVVKTTVHLADIKDLPAMNAVYQEYFSTPYPVRTTVQSGLSGFLVGIDAVAQFE